MQTKKSVKAAIYCAVAAVFLLIVVYASVRLTPQLLPFIKNRVAMRETLLSYGWKGIFVYLGLQMLQVFIAFIPGEPIMLAGGYIYGVWAGTLLITAGIFAGEALTFYVTRLIGMPLVRLFVPQQRHERFTRMINGKKGEIAIFLLFLIPGIPKDLLVYVAGVSPVRPLRFLLLSMTARLPGIVGTALIGSSLQTGNYLSALIISAVAGALFVAGVLLKERVLQWLENHLHHHTPPGETRQ
ncbi:MAG: TVP38/TMEM64 family protein [Clostridia bacterium]|nr:TVP38/TMEM64 family protein [Clostridia bacterium]